MHCRSAMFGHFHVIAAQVPPLCAGDCERQTGQRGRKMRALSTEDQKGTGQKGGTIRDKNRKGPKPLISGGPNDKQPRHRRLFQGLSQSCEPWTVVPKTLDMIRQSLLCPDHCIRFEFQFPMPAAGAIGHFPEVSTDSQTHTSCIGGSLCW
eukprot:1684830-Amphidinium_carterae.1